MQKPFGLIFAVAGLLAFFSCENTASKEYVKADGTRFVDGSGRELIFNGVNVICKDPRKNYTEQVQQIEFSNLASYGFNAIRLGIIWSGIEPEPGIYDEEYLNQIDQLISWAEEAGLYLLLDMHQDLFGQKFSDGAPDWATLDMGLPHHTGSIWSDSYMISPAVQASWDNFWDNAHVADGLGVQDHYVNMWKMLADRYKEHRHVLGFDLMNEPFMGSGAQNVMPLLIQAYAHKMMDMEAAWIDGSLEGRMQALAEQWAQEQGRLDLLRTLENPELYGSVIQAAGPLCQAFETDHLNAFYQKLRDSIRTVNKHHILFLEHNYFSNTGMESAICVPKDESGGPDPLVAYAAHGYDLVTDTKEVGSPSFSRVDYIFRNIFKKSKDLNIPLIIGEWGAYGGDHPVYRETAGAIISLFEEFGCSQTYWAYNGIDFSQKCYFPVLSRVYPAALSGRLHKYVYNPGDGSFFMEYETTGLEKYPTRIFLPQLDTFNRDKLVLFPEARITLEPLPTGGGAYLIIPPGRFAGIRKISYY